MIKRRFYKLEHGDKDSGSDSSCFSSDSDPEIEESEDSESESEEAVAQVSEEDDDDDSGEEEDESPAVEDDADADVDDEDDSDDDGYRRSLKKTSMKNRDFNLEEPPEEEEENYILGCMTKVKSVYKCRYCPEIICLNEKSMEAHVSSKKHAYLERLHKEVSSDDDDEEKPSQVKGNRRSQRQGKRSALKKGKLEAENGEADKSETPSQIKGNRKARRQGMKPQNPEKVYLIKQRESADATQRSRKKRRQTKD